MSALGADPAALDDLARLLDRLANEITHRRHSLGVWIEGDRFWKGPAANEFRHAWTQQYSPELALAVDYLHTAVTALHENANQQRTASGEASRDYGGNVSAFTQSLFGKVDHLSREALRDLKQAERLEQVGAGRMLSDSWHGVKVIGASKGLAEVIGVAQVVGTVAAFMPPPADSIAVAAGGVVMLGHLAQMANKGKFDPGEFGEDAIGFAGLGAVKGLSSVAKFKAITGAADDSNNLRLATDAPARARLWSFAGNAARKAVVIGVVGDRVVNAGIDGGRAVANTSADLRQGNYKHAALDSAGYGLAVLDLAGKHQSDTGVLVASAQADLDIRLESDGGRVDVPTVFAREGGYEE